MTEKPFKYGIDKGVPLPKRRGKEPHNFEPTIYPFGAMQVGDSFFAPGISNSAAVAAADYSRLHPGVKFASRAFERDPLKCLAGHRIWRTA